jgi:hypothetical protein
MSMLIHHQCSEERERESTSRPFAAENAPCDGYELYRLLKDGVPQSLLVNGSTYTLQFEGQKTDVQSWLLVTDEHGGSIRLAPGWSSEACWNALTTLERGLWEKPVGHWQSNSQWEQGRPTDEESLVGSGLTAHFCYGASASILSCRSTPPLLA